MAGGLADTTLDLDNSGHDMPLTVGSIAGSEYLGPRPESLPP